MADSNAKINKNETDTPKQPGHTVERLKQEEDNIVPAGEDNSKTDESESEKGGTAQEKTSEAEAMEIAHTETLAPEATELTNNLTLKPELTTEDDAVAPDKESSPKDDSETVGRKDQVTDDQCQEGSPNGQTASGPKSVEDIDNRSKQEEDNKVPAGEDNSKTDDSGSEKRGTAQEMPPEPKAMETAHTTLAPEAKEVDHKMSLESNGSDTQDDTVTQDKESSPKDGSGTVGSEDPVTADQCQEGSQIGLNQSQSALETESEENTDNSKQKKEHEFILKGKDDEIDELKTKMRRQKKEHDSILKQNEDEIDSLGKQMSLESSTYASNLHEHAKNEAAMASAISDMEDTILQLNNFSKEQGSSIATLNSQFSAKVTIIQENEKRIWDLDIESKRFQTAAEVTKCSNTSRIASMEVENAMELERARQSYWDKWEAVERNHSQELKKRETNTTEMIEDYEKVIDKQRKESEAKENKCRKESDQLRKEVESISKKKSELETETQKNKATIRTLKTKNTDISKSLKRAEEDNHRVSEQIESQTKILSAMTKRDDSSHKEVEAIKKANDPRERYLQQREEMYRRETEKLNSEITRLTLRLSKIASAKMTTGNSAIADLSDGFRPTKISELFSELYDNQWTDAFDQLTTASDREDKDAILLLLEILQESYKKCGSTAQSHLQGVKDAMCIFRIQATQEPVSQENDVTKADLEVPDEAWKMIMDFHKAAAYISKGEIARIISSSQMEGRGFMNMNKVGDYMKTCAEICWLMAVQDPPVVVDVLDVPQDCQRSFNKDRYRAYTRTGKFYDFTVWPALLLQKDGPILCKGVAQGK